MNFQGKIDLHMHTTVSDGTDTPEEIVSRVREAGIVLFSVTDHDDIKAAKIIPKLLSGCGPFFVSGVEFSCRDSSGKYHILGYNYDPKSRHIRRLVKKGHRFRIKKVKARIDFLKKSFGFRFPKEELDALFALNNPGKPHIANMMVRLGYAKDKSDAINNYINLIHFKEEYVTPGEAIKGILKSGGIPVLAHPFYGDGDDLILGDEMEARVIRLKGLGLKGLEAFYSGFTPRLIMDTISLAERHGLYVTAGSDYHGKNKMVVLGDTNLSEDDGLPEGLERFLEEIKETGRAGF